MAYNSGTLDEIIKAFERWFINDTHSKIEDFYSNAITFENISKLSQIEFEDFFLEFAREGGKIQSGGYRTANRLIQNVHENYSNFRQKVLAPFLSDFDVFDWIIWADTFKFFGKGLATIYLNRVDKSKFVVVNNKSIEAYRKLGYDVAISPLGRTYKDLLYAQTDLIKIHPELSNYFRTDALAHFLIGTPEGRSFSEEGIVPNFKTRNITRQDVEKAIERINRVPDLRKGRESIEYDLVHDGIKYPPILVLSEANKIAGGQELLLSDFGNSTKSAFSILITLGFTIERKKNDFSEQLKKFLSQSDDGSLTTTGYVNTFEGLKVKVSFGQGNQARIPWIAFLSDGNTVQNGIYPVYLYFKRNKALILAYGVSETSTPSASWNLSNPKSISTYFEENQIGRPERYGNSFVYKKYDTSNSLNSEEINNDLIDLITFYKQDINSQTITNTSQQVEFNYSIFNECTNSSNLFFDKKLIVRFISALVTKPFVILTGLSGSGKTKLAQAFAKWICNDNNQYCIVPVGADWTNREPLLGYPNALNPAEYVKPDNGTLDLIIRANENPELPYFLILDEMNLSHVERYFADFLSVMESHEEIKLFAEGETHNGVPCNLRLPSNLFIIGTVNIDETTYMFSPKVLDRANVIEFRVTMEEIDKFLSDNKGLKMEELETKGSSMARSFLDMAKNEKFEETNLQEVNKTFVAFFEQLKKSGAEFGYRSAAEMQRLINQLSVIEQGISENEMIDISIMQKLLPKLHGSRRKLCPVLLTLGRFCVTEEIENVEKEVFDAGDFNFNSIDHVKYPLSLEKITRMYQGAIDNGFTSYTEA